MGNFNVEITLTLNHKDDGGYGVFFMGEEILSLNEAVNKSDGNHIHDALVKVFSKGVELGVVSTQNGLSSITVTKNT